MWKQFIAVATALLASTQLLLARVGLGVSCPPGCGLCR